MGRRSGRSRSRRSGRSRKSRSRRSGRSGRSRMGGGRSRMGGRRRGIGGRRRIGGKKGHIGISRRRKKRMHHHHHHNKSHIANHSININIPMDMEYYEEPLDLNPHALFIDRIQDELSCITSCCSCCMFLLCPCFCILCFCCGYNRNFTWLMYNSAKWNSSMSTGLLAVEEKPELLKRGLTNERLMQEITIFNKLSAKHFTKRLPLLCLKYFPLLLMTISNLLLFYSLLLMINYLTNDSFSSNSSFMDLFNVEEKSNTVSTANMVSELNAFDIENNIHIKYFAASIVLIFICILYVCCLEMYLVAKFHKSVDVVRNAITELNVDYKEIQISWSMQIGYDSHFNGIIVTPLDVNGNELHFVDNDILGQNGGGMELQAIQLQMANNHQFQPRIPFQQIVIQPQQQYVMQPLPPQPLVYGNVAPSVEEYNVGNPPPPMDDGYFQQEGAGAVFVD